MSHSENINRNIYQTPLVEAEILKVGSQLQLMDEQYAAGSASSVAVPSVSLGNEQEQSKKASEAPSDVDDNDTREYSLQPSRNIEDVLHCRHVFNCM